MYVSQGLIQEIKITGKEGVLSQIDAMVTNNVLEIEYDTCFSNPNSIKIYNTIKTIHKLWVNGSENISTLHEISSDKLELNIRGSGDINVEAKATTVSSKINGSGNIKLSGSSKTLKIKIKGSGEVN